MSEWGQWIEHDGSECPVPGQYGQAVLAKGKLHEAILGLWYGPEDGTRVSHWNWSDPVLQQLLWDERVVSFRVRKPKGLTLLEELIREKEVA